MARHRESYETTNGPIDVDVALAWRTRAYRSGAQPAIDSFVNLARTRDHGSHVDGLFDGIHAFIGGRPRKTSRQGLVAAVGVVLADVKFGNPTRDRRATPEVRGPVADATRKALVAWGDDSSLVSSLGRGMVCSRWAVSRERLPRKGSVMWQAKFDLPEVDRDRARTLIATIEQRLASDTIELRAAWRELVALLAFEQRAEARACPNCRRLSRVAAKRCAYCWHTLEPRSL